MMSSPGNEAGSGGRQGEEATLADAVRLSVSEAAPILGLSVHTIRAWIRERRVPFYRVGRRIVLDRADLEKGAVGRLILKPS